jgi:hypothetical protein
MFKRRANCPQCGAKLGIHNRKAPNITIIYLLISLCFGAPIGGYAGQLVSYLVFFRDMDMISFIVGGIVGTIFLFLFLYLHEVKEISRRH